MDMKKVFLTLLLAVISTGAFAQFGKGTKYVSTSISGLNLNYNKNSEFTLGLQASGGYFVCDSWMLLGQLGWDHRKNFNDFTIGAAGRYYIEQNGIYLNLGLKYQHIGPTVANNIYLTPEVGYCFYLNRHVSVEPALYYDMCLNEYSNFSTVGLKIGFGFYF